MTDERRVALITGAGGGLGGAVARLLAESGGHDLALVDVRADALQSIAGELREMGSRVEELPADLAEVPECERVVSETIDRLGRVDILVNAAAVLAREELEGFTDRSFDRIFHINARAPFFLCRAVSADMEKRGWGRIVNVTSTGVYEGGFTMTSAPYEGSKGAVAVFTKMYAKYGASKGILVNSLCPGGMRTRMLLEETPPELLEKAEKELIPLGRLADPVEMARMILWLVGDDNTYATGAEFDITGGLAIH